MTRADRLLRGLLPAALLIGMIAGLAGPEPLRGHAAPQLAPADKIVISEFRSTGPNGGDDEFVELYNLTTRRIDISGWYVNWADANSSPGNLLATIPTNTFIDSGHYYLIADTVAGGYSGTANPDLSYLTDNGVIPDNGGIALFDQSDHVIDQVGMDAGTIYKEGTALNPALLTDPIQSFERKPGQASGGNCTDTNDNANDFSVLTAADPQNLASAAGTCLLPDATTSITAHTPDPSVVGQPIAIQFAVLPNTATGEVTVSDGSVSCNAALANGTGTCNLTPTSAGTKNIVATYGGDTSVIGSVSAAVSHTVNRADTSISITAHNPNPSSTGQFITVSVTVAANSPATGTPTGKVTVTDGVDSCSIASLAAGSGSCQISLRTVGARTIRADYQGDTNFNPSTASVAHSVIGAQVLINEVAWAGTQAFPVTAANPDQWIELWNTSGITISLLGWSIEDGDGNVVVSWENTSTIANDPNHLEIAPNEYYLIECTDDQAVSTEPADKYFACDLSQTGEILYLFGSGGNLVDTANLGGGPWPAGSLSLWRSMERKDTGTRDSSWATFMGTVRTERDAGNNLINGTPGFRNWVTTVPTALPPTRVPTPRPQPKPRPVINEFLPRAGFDWNNDGRVDVFDEFIEVANLGPADWNTRGWRLDDDANAGSGAFSLPQLTLKPGERAVFYGSQSNVHLSDGGETIRLLDPSGKVYDAQTYPVVKQADLSWCRLPDLRGSWFTDCFPTPNFPNSREGKLPSLPPTTGLEEVRCTLADTLPQEFILAECRGYGDNMWSSRYWDLMGWISDRLVKQNGSKWESFVE